MFLENPHLFIMNNSEIEYKLQVYLGEKLARHTWDFQLISNIKNHP